MPDPVAYRCPCGFEGPDNHNNYRDAKPDEWRNDEMGCFHDDPECSHPAVVCPKCGKWFDLCGEVCNEQLLTHIYADGTRREPHA